MISNIVSRALVCRYVLRAGHMRRTSCWRAFIYQGRQFKYMVEYGMTPLQAIHAATVRAAELIGWPDDIGAIEAGRFADIIAVTGNPLEDVGLLENVRFVMKGGKVYKQ